MPIGKKRKIEIIPTALDTQTSNHGECKKEEGCNAAGFSAILVNGRVYE
jgi:hypothetical protein